MAKQRSNFFFTHNEKSNSCVVFTPHWICWKILGITLDFANSQYIYLLFSFILHTMVSICYPVHLALALSHNNSMANNIKTLGGCISCMSCAMKFILYATRLNRIRKFEQILKTLDERIASEEEKAYFGRMKTHICNMCLVFICLYAPVAITAGLSFIFRKERNLLYMAWFPFNWLESTSLYILANIYQIFGIFVFVLQNYLNDIFPPMALCILSGHIKCLAIRVAHIGYDDKTQRENQEELKRCVQDQNRLYELCTAIEDIISWPIFIQFCVGAITTCLSITAVMFFSSTTLDILYHLLIFLATIWQLFPTFYYGSDFQYQFDQLHFQIYASNWTTQTVKYKKHIILFMERSLKEKVLLAGGIVPIDLNTFFLTCRLSYSLVAIVTKIK